VFGTLLDKSTGWLDKRLVATVLLPLLAFCAGIAALVIAHYGWQAASIRWDRIDGAQQAVIAGGAVTALLLATQLSGIFLQPLIRVFEGYWMLRRSTAPLGHFGCRAERRRWDRLTLTDPRDYARRYREFPPRREQVMPTRLGNAIRAAESYASDEARYGVDAVFFWPRLYPLLPDALRASLDAARASLEQMLFVTFLFALLGPVTVALAIMPGLPAAIWVPVTASTLLMSLISYRAGVAVAVSYGELVRSAFDTHRLTLLASLGFAPPPDLESERRVWRSAAQRLYRRDSDDSEPDRRAG
jgi:hypothetical protein